jgi:hypothetical protein
LRSVEDDAPAAALSVRAAAVRRRIRVLGGLALPLGTYFLKLAFLAFFFVFFLVVFFLCVMISGFGSSRVLPE